MKYKFLTATILFGLLGASRAWAQADTNAPAVTDYSTFQGIATHNIFNPSRTSSRGNTQRTYTRTLRTDYFTLVGTMSYEKGQYAFFDGNSTAYHKTLYVGQTIAGYKIAEIGADSIKLAASSNRTISLPIGTQMRRPEGGYWTVAGRAEPIPPSTDAAPDAASPTASSSATSTNASPGLGGAENDAMKRLMLKRLTEK